MAFNTTTRELLDYVLRRLRKTTLADQSLTSIATAGTYNYENMILGFVQDAIREVEGAWDWVELRRTVTVTVTAPAVDLMLHTTSSISDINVPNQSRLMYVKGTVDNDEVESTQWSSSPMVYDVTDAAEVQLTEVTPQQMEHLRLMDNNETGDPEYFCLEQTALSLQATTGGHLRLKIHPIPTDTRTLKLRFFIPSTTLVNNALTTDGIDIPALPVQLRALYYANQERGSNLGMPDSPLDKRATEELQNAIATQMTYDDLTGVPR